MLLIAAGDHPERLRSEGSWAHLCGVAPIPASSGKTAGRYRLNRGGDRQASSALWRIVTVHTQRYGCSGHPCRLSRPTALGGTALLCTQELTFE